MKNYSIRKAAGVFCLLLSGGSAVSASSIEAHSHYSSNTYKLSRPGDWVQQQQLTGTVRDNGGVLPGATVSIKGKATTTITDASGVFAIAAIPGDTLVVTSMGCESREITVVDYTPLQITLIVSATSLQEVTINAGYYTVKDKERTGSIARITSKDIETQPVTKGQT
ncbi:MAG: SusC/RagA family TonB-linked outer membrane protein, partial [Moraxellaceae bacterium]